MAPLELDRASHRGCAAAYGICSGSAAVLRAALVAAASTLKL